MIIPNYLNPGDKIGIVAPARWIEQDKYLSVINIIENYGYKVVRGKSTFLEHGPFAGTDNERAKDMQLMLDNVSIKAIFCLRGGYGTVRIIENLDFSKFIKQPKWIIGFSDITIFHNTVHKLGICSIHGQMPLNFTGRTENKGLEKLFETLSGKTLSYKIPFNKNNKCGQAESTLVGGNVAILSSLIGSDFDLNTDGKILFIEEVGEYLYRFDRLMYHLKLSGKLKNIAGLIVGGLSEMKDNDPSFQQSVNEIITDLVKESDFPICFDFPAGHIKENYPLILGKKVRLLVTEEQSDIAFL